jgi:hypothetical protein
MEEQEQPYPGQLSLGDVVDFYLAVLASDAKKRSSGCGILGPGATAVQSRRLAANISAPGSDRRCRGGPYIIISYDVEDLAGCLRVFLLSQAANYDLGTREHGLGRRGDGLAYMFLANGSKDGTLVEGLIRAKLDIEELCASVSVQIMAAVVLARNKIGRIKGGFAHQQLGRRAIANIGCLPECTLDAKSDTK